MAKLLVSEELILQSLFPGKIGLRLRGITFDARNQAAELDLEGHQVPDCERITCTVTLRSLTHDFIPITE